MGDYRELHVWREAHRLVLRVYKVTRAFPQHEIYGLTGQARRAAASIPANLAEGAGRGSDAELRRFAGIALGSANELEYHLLLARDLGCLSREDQTEIARQVQKIKNMLAKLVRSLGAASRQPVRPSTVDRRP